MSLSILAIVKKRKERRKEGGEGRRKEGRKRKGGKEEGRKERRKGGRKEGKGRKEGREGGREEGRKEGREGGREERRKGGRREGGGREGEEGWWGRAWTLVSCPHTPRKHVMMSHCPFLGTQVLKTLQAGLLRTV